MKCINVAGCSLKKQPKTNKQTNKHYMQMPIGTEPRQELPKGFVCVCILQVFQI